MDTEKRERNVIDFNDMEHMALNILVKKTENGMEYTKAADDLSSYYEEILIDEYQDSNMLQEVILTAVSKGKYNEADNNIYMVGDVKQSIYKFRLACPKLFMDKYSTYTDTDSPNVRIELQTNFRSRENVLECTNDVFYRAMNPYFAEIEYDDRARLNAGFEYPKYQAQNENAMTFADDPDTMIYMIDMNQEKLSPEDEDRSAREREGAAAAALIQRLTQPKEDGSFYMVYDKNAENGYRRIRYSDIVILTRTVSGWADTFVNVLMNEDIPAYCDASEGYFDVREVKLLLSYLAVIDNPLQDIPMAAVMLSFFGRFTTEELTQIRMKDTTKHLYNVMQESNDKKVVQFLKQLDSFREKAERYPVSDVLWELMYDTGYYHYAGTMPAGTQRQANLDMLYTKAAAFEKTSYSGLFQFLRYIERLKKYEVDFAEASVLGENENLVRVMSIHKSKGLEFPVVILAGMGKSINQMDSRGEVVLDTDFGVGTNVVHLDKRIKNPTLLKSAVSQKLIQETISEELRVLYVAMTRAREKLYMIGTVKDAQKAVEGWQAVSDELLAGGWYSYSYEAGLKNYFDMLMPAVLLPQNLRKGTFQIVEFKKEELQVSDDISMEVSQAETDISKEAGQELEKLPDYPYADEPVMKPKVTVSELKKMQQDSDFAETAYMPESLKQAVDEQNEDELLPEFIAGRKKTLQGSRRGTAYHRVMECMDYDTEPENTAVKAFLKRLVEEEKLTKQQADSIRVSDIVAFMKNPLFERMKRAKQVGVFHTEQPFVFIDLSEQSDKSKQDDTNQPDKNNGGQLIQGVIDVYFEEDGSLILVDYKTDKVSKKGGEDELRRRYALQLEYYAKALSQLLQKPVKEKNIYSFSLGKDIVLE
jgi:ATP-dependent helicase/nuclease subunit A